MDTQHTGRANLNLLLACISVHDLKVGITWQGYSTPTFTVYRKENLNLSYIRANVRETNIHWLEWLKKIFIEMIIRKITRYHLYLNA